MITRAAVKLYLIQENKEIILPVHRHCDAFKIMKLLGYKPGDYKDKGQGFLTNKNIYLDREAAAEHAYACGQLKDDIESIHITTLFSEDLW